MTNILALMGELEFRRRAHAFKNDSENARLCAELFGDKCHIIIKLKIIKFM